MSSWVASTSTVRVFEPIVGRTIEALRKIDPRYIVPTHCTGRKSIQQIEEAMPDELSPEHGGDAADLRGLIALPRIPLPCREGEASAITP